jgi:hypothetical protein
VLAAVLAMSAAPTSGELRTCYRIVRSDPPTVEDFRSAAARGRIPPDANAEDRRLLAGVSVYRTEAQARRKARQYPALGAFIAELALPPQLVAERTTPSPGHHTLWAPPEALLACVVRVVPVARSS